MAKKQGRMYGGLSAEERKQRRRACFLDAALQQFGTRGVAAVKLKDILAEAGLSERYFYESFENLDELGNALVEHHLGLLMHKLSKLQLPSAQPQNDIRTILTLFVEHIIIDTRVGRLLLHETLAPSGALSTQKINILTTAEQVALGWIERMFANDPEKHDVVDAKLTAAAMIGASAQLWLAWVDGRFDTSAERIVDHLTKLFESALNVHSDAQQ